MPYQSQLSTVRQLASTYQLFQTSDGTFDGAAFNAAFNFVRFQVELLYLKEGLDAEQGFDYILNQAELVFWIRCCKTYLGVDLGTYADRQTVEDEQYGKFDGTAGPFPGLPQSWPWSFPGQRPRKPYDIPTPRDRSIKRPSNDYTGPQAQQPTEANLLSGEPNWLTMAMSRPCLRHAPVALPPSNFPADLPLYLPYTPNPKPLIEFQGGHREPLLESNRNNLVYTYTFTKKDGKTRVEAKFQDFSFTYTQIKHKPWTFTFELHTPVTFSPTYATALNRRSLHEQIEMAHKLLSNHTGLPFHALPNLEKLIKEERAQ